MQRKRFGDLPKSARIYVTWVCLAGACTAIHAFYQLISQQPKWDWTILAVLTLVSGSATVRLPSLPATFSVSETFVVTSVLLFGPAAGTLTVALDALVISCWAYYRKGQPFYKSVFNVCALPLSVWVASHLFFVLADTGPLAINGPQSGQAFPIKDILLPLLAFTVAYFSLNSGIIAIAISLEKQFSPLRIWRENFVWLSLNYFGGASVAVLLVTYTRNIDLTYLAVIVPLLFILYFTFSMSMGRVEDANRHLTQLNTLYMSTIETLAMAIDAKDQITHGHIRRVQTYAVGLAKRVGVSDENVLRAVEAAALLHDMGKLAVPEYILNKPGPLTAAEFEKMKLHASVGADILSAIDFPYPVVPIVRHHHENWDGSGYPDGLAGSSIPIGARILSVVDCFDALTSDRPYRPRLSDQDALRILTDRRGKMYDPVIVDTFLVVFRELAPESSREESTIPMKAIAALSPTLPSTHRLEEISGSSEEMLTLFELAKGLRPDLDLETLCEGIFAHVRRLIPASLCVFFVYEVDTDELVAIYASGDSSPLILGTRIALGQRVSGWVAAHRQSIRNSDPAIDLGTAARVMRARPKSSLSTAVAEGPSLVGVLTLYSTHPAAFTEDHQRILQAVAAQVGGPLRDAFERSSNFPSRSSGATLKSSPLASERLDDHRPAAMILARLVSRRLSDEPPEEISVRTARDVLLMCIRNGDEVFEVQDGLAAILPNADHTTADLICGRMRDLLALRDPNFRLQTVVVTAPQDGLTLNALLESARLRISNTSRPDSVH